MTFEEFSRRLDAYIERYRSEKVKKALGWKTIGRHREELGHAARLDVRKNVRGPHGNPETTPKLVTLPDFLRRAYQSLPMSVLQAYSLGEKWRCGLLALSVSAGPRTHPLHRRQRDGSKHAQ